MFLNVSDHLLQRNCPQSAKSHQGVEQATFSVSIDLHCWICFIMIVIIDDSYQNDAFSEIEKAHSHNNTPIIITNSFDNRFDKTDMDVIKIPYVAREISLLSYIILFKKLLF